MSWPLRVLLVDIPKSEADHVLERLRRDGYDVTYACVSSPAAMCALLAQPETWDLMVIDDATQARALKMLDLLLPSTKDLPSLVTVSQIGRKAD